VAPPTEAGENHSPGLMASVATYNKLLAAAVLAAQAPHVLLVDAHAALSVNAGTLARCINQQDGHHLTAAGHQLYAELLQQNFEQLPRERLIIE
jgi:lysophospholipase L1-like esterase